MTAALSFDDQGWSELYDERGAGGMSGIGAVDPAPLLYVPDLSPVGSGSTYNPGSITQDAHALNFLGFIPDALLPQVRDTSGNVPQDQQLGLGAFGAIFKQAVTDFQQTAGGLTVDGFIGPKTRTALGLAVAAKNATTPTAPPFVPPIVPPAPGIPPNLPAVVPPGVVPPGLQPSSQTDDKFPLMPVAIVGGIIVLGVAAYFLLD